MSHNRRQYLLDKVIEQNESIFVNIDFTFGYQLPRIPILDKKISPHILSYIWPYCHTFTYNNSSVWK